MLFNDPMAVSWVFEFYALPSQKFYGLSLYQEAYFSILFYQTNEDAWRSQEPLGRPASISPNFEKSKRITITFFSLSRTVLTENVTCIKLTNFMLNELLITYIEDNL